jgi:hypothetical protein
MLDEKVGFHPGSCLEGRSGSFRDPLMRDFEAIKYNCFVKVSHPCPALAIRLVGVPKLGDYTMDMKGRDDARGFV